MEKVNEGKEDANSCNRIVKESENCQRVNEKNEKFPRKKRRDFNILDVLNNREQDTRIHGKLPRATLDSLLETKVASSEYKQTVCQLPLDVRSTFYMAFSSNGELVLTNHGDTNIYLTEVFTGKTIHRYHGHFGVPWCIQFHPSLNGIFASGSVEGEVRVWKINGDYKSWKSAYCIHSLRFHPTESLLAIASRNAIHFWSWEETVSPQRNRSTSSVQAKVGYVEFNNSGDCLITGIFERFPKVCRCHCEYATETTESRNAKRKIEEVASDSSDVETLSSGSDIESSPEEEVEPDSIDVEILSSGSDTESSPEIESICESQDASSPLVEDMSSSSSIHNKPGCSSSSAFFPSINSSIPSTDCEGVLVCESQDASSPLVEDTRSSNMGVENDHDVAAGLSGLYSAASNDSGIVILHSSLNSSQEVALLHLLESVRMPETNEGHYSSEIPNSPFNHHEDTSVSSNQTSGQRQSTVENELTRPCSPPELETNFWQNFNLDGRFCYHIGSGRNAGK
ncbi:activating molecule in BECN1-regulated autophagy protein 1 [Trichonephila clavata]|uniref:Activating molecule in BECN1-regulated autophagy protein 1 n=1 Tax=Trichonephila clavata TaxID=2740835 RepID=A0A8X6LX30_TRICU|nr:activating molecule in BECN1-regulated autophagy protein 1 [Trichonephila clavata]